MSRVNIAVLLGATAAIVLRSLAAIEPYYEFLEQFPNHFSVEDAFKRVLARIKSEVRSENLSSELS